MKYERRNGPIFHCRDCKRPGRYRWWWNRQNYQALNLCRMCKNCGRKRNYKLINDFLTPEQMGIYETRKRL